MGGGAGVARVGWLSWKWVLARVSSMEDSQADSLQVLQALVHLQGLSQGHGTSISNGIARKPARDNDELGLGVRARRLPLSQECPVQFTGPQLCFILVSEGDPYLP